MGRELRGDFLVRGVLMDRAGMKGRLAQRTCRMASPEGIRYQRQFLVAAHSFAIGQDILIVFCHGAGEAMVALGVGYEIVVIGLGWMHRGL
jgi:hypothetical protein